MKAVGVLLGGDRREHARRVHLLGQRQLDEDPVHAAIRVQRGDAVEQLLRGHAGGEFMQHRAHARFLAGAHLVAHIDARGGIVADEDRGEAGPHAARGEPGDLVLHRGADRSGERFAVEDLSGHGYASGPKKARESTT